MDADSVAADFAALEQEMAVQVLVVEDDATTRLLLQEMIRQHTGYEVTAAESAEEARMILPYMHFSLILCDSLLPGESGLEFLAWARKQHPEIPVVMLTAQSGAAKVAEAMRLGAHRLLHKPFLPEELANTVTEVIHSTELQRQNARLRWELANYNTRLRQEVIEARIENEHLFFATLTALANAIDARDAYTCAHSSQVAYLTAALAKKLELDWTLQHAAESAAQLHDIGKIAVPEQILLKPARLTAEEFRRIQEHPGHGAQILSPLPDCEYILPAVRHHHEKFDGSGYPDHLKGDDIPYLARLIAVCDTWSAMRTTRPYRQTMPFEAAAAIIREERGRQFDPEVAEAFLEIIAVTEPSSLPQG